MDNMRVNQILLICLLSVSSSYLAAVDSPRQDDDHSYDKALRALDRGEILSLEQVVKHLRKHSQDRIVATEYEYEFDRWVYEFKLIDIQGRMSKIHIDAQQGDLLQVADD